MIDPSSAGFIKDVGIDNFLTWTRGADVLFPNAEEAALLSGAAKPEIQLEILNRHYGQVVLTQGAEGALAIDADGTLVHVGATKAEIVDTTGAGDAFVGGFLAAKLAGKSLKDCLEAGVAQGALAVSNLGAQPT